MKKVKKLGIILLVFVCMSFTTTTEQTKVIREIGSQGQINIKYSDVKVSLWEVDGKKFVIALTRDNVAITHW